MSIPETESAYKPIIYGQQTPNVSGQKEPSTTVGLFGHSGDQEFWDGMDEGTLSKTKEMLDDMHKRKIDMADYIYVINVGGYIGDSTRSEIEYAKKAW